MSVICKEERRLMRAAKAFYTARRLIGRDKEAMRKIIEELHAAEVHAVAETASSLAEATRWKDIMLLITNYSHDILSMLEYDGTEDAMLDRTCRLAQEEMTKAMGFGCGVFF